MRMRSILLAGVGVLLGGLFVVPGATAQTRFTWPDTTVDYTNYTFLEQCEAAAERTLWGIVKSHSFESTVWWDTMPHNLRVANDTADAGKLGVWQAPARKAVYQAVAQRCGGKHLEIDSVPLRPEAYIRSDKFPVLARLVHPAVIFPSLFRSYVCLFADAGADQKLLAYLDQYLQNASQAALEAALKTVVQCLDLSTSGATATGPSYMPPDRLRLYDTILGRYAPRLTDHVQRATFYAFPLMDDTHAALDTAAALRVARRLAKFVADSLTPQERDSFWQLARSSLQHPFPWGDFYQTLDQWLRYFTDLTFNRDQGIDSLRKSTDAYLTFLASTMLPGFKGFDSFDQLPAPYQNFWKAMGLGVKVPPLQAVAWAGPAVTGPRPTPGRVSYVFFWTARNCGETGAAIDNAEEFRDNCAATLIGLRRLIDSFPELEVTLATRTFGYFRFVVDSMTPAKEAELTYQMLAKMGVKTVPVAIVDPAYRRLPEPDGRIMEGGDNDTNVVAYRTPGIPPEDPTPKLGAHSSVGSGGSGLLIDSDGRVVARDSPGVMYWSVLAEKVKALFQRKRSTP